MDVAEVKSKGGPYWSYILCYVDNVLVVHNDATKILMSYTDQKFADCNGKEQFRRTTMGWQMCVQWKDDSTPWEKLSDIKECYPVQASEYSIK